MKKLILVLLLIVTARGFAAHNLQQAACFPRSEEAKDWPVQAIYLAGIYSQGTTSDVVENSNRDYLENYARANRIRIAVPVARVLNRVHQWNGMSLATIEASASAACGGAPLAQERAIIGYSNGGRYVGELSSRCGENGAYTKFLVIGYPEATRGRCPDNDKRYSAIANHSQFQSMSSGISSQLAALPSNGGGTSVAALDKNEAVKRGGEATGKVFTPPPHKEAPPSEQQAQVQPAQPVAVPPAPATKPAAPANCCQGECTSIDIGLSIETSAR